MKDKQSLASALRSSLVVLGLFLATAQLSQAQVCGCTDSMATNYNPEATVNDGGCEYAPQKVKAVAVGSLDLALRGSSTLFCWNKGYWTYNDHNDNCIYRLDSTSGTSMESLCIQGIKNRDTEEISQDSLYLYFGDFGNNSGTRRDLCILRVNKESIINQQVVIDTLWFSYEDQTDFSSHPQATDFDCEAFIVTDDSIYLFTKQWVSAQTAVYSLPKTPGSHIAHKRGCYNVKGLITGVTYISEYQLIVLCGYDYNKNNVLSALKPFMVLLYDFKDNLFFSGNKRRLDFSYPTRAQIEGVATSNALDYYLTSEHFKTTKMGITFDFPAQLWRVDLRKYLLPYIKSKSRSDGATNVQ
ncbi:MAG: hypothetical protein J6T59_01525 [Bacteroidales bacterium]|nr:hypothetical protein [Bacteroidales bacterium]